MYCDEYMQVVTHTSVTIIKDIPVLLSSSGMTQAQLTTTYGYSGTEVS